MMSHDNLTWTARTAVTYLNVEKDDKLVKLNYFSTDYGHCN